MKMANQTLFSHATVYSLSMVAGKKTIDCCTGTDWYYRDNDVDVWLERYQLFRPDCFITALTPARDWTFFEAAACVLGVSRDTPMSTLSELLIQNEYTTTLSQDEELVQAILRGENTGMVTQGYSNFVFKRNNPTMRDGISVAGMCLPALLNPLWDVILYRLDCSKYWNTQHRLLIPNLDPSLLGL